MSQADNKQLIERLSRSQIYQDYERAFNQTTGLPLQLRSAEVWQWGQAATKHENPFCLLLSKHSRSCAACLQVQEKLVDSSGSASKTVTCFAGLCDTAVPVKAGEKLIGFLQTGQILLKKPTKRQFARTTRQLLDWGLNVNLKQLEESYFHTRVLKSEQYESMIGLLVIFSQHLALVGQQVLLQAEHAEPPAVTRARRFIQDHQADNLSLNEVARAVNTSTFYFCKLFRRVTGLKFTEYLSRVRVEKAKSLLLHPNLRISEVAYQIGFQSLTNFNRVFKRVAGQSPTSYRERLPKFSAN